jgi:NADH:ubiquinone oxidoreductase subunit C
MDQNNPLASAEELLKPWSSHAAYPKPNRLDLTVSSSDLYNAVGALVKAQWGYLSAITGLDHPGSGETSPEETRWDRLTSVIDGAMPPKTGSLEVLYHFVEGNGVLTLRVSISRGNPAVPSICALLPTASLFERELSEMFGINVPGTPNTDHFILPEDWTPGVYPLRKDFTGLKPADQA